MTTMIMGNVIYVNEDIDLNGLYECGFITCNYSDFYKRTNGLLNDRIFKFNNAYVYEKEKILCLI